MGDVLTIVGRSDGIKEKSQGWYEVEVLAPGKKYPVRLATKSSTILDQVRETNGGTATFTYTESESEKINPNSGKPYINRYLEGCVAGATTEAQAASDSDRMTKEEWNAKDRRDFRSRAWAQTISAFAHTIEVGDDPVLIFARLKPFQRKLYEDIVQELEPKPQQQQPQQQVDEPPPHDDDDIPF